MKCYKCKGFVFEDKDNEFKCLMCGEIQYFREETCPLPETFKSKYKPEGLIIWSFRKDLTKVRMKNVVKAPDYLQTYLGDQERILWED